jgi:hypothetical protein
MACRIKVSPYVLIAFVTLKALLPVGALADDNPSSARLGLDRLASVPGSIANWVQHSIWSIGHTPPVPRPGECDKGAAPGCGYVAWQWFGNRPDQRYEGEYSNGAPNGHGVYTWSDGARYEGEFRNGKFHGRGTFIWAGGNRYEGEWANGEPHGAGQLTTARHVFAGIWANGCFRDSRAWMAVGREASSCEDLRNGIIVRESPAQRRFSALFACIEAGQQPDAMCVSEIGKDR